MIDPGSLVGAGAVIGIYCGTRTVVKYVKAREARAARLKQEREQQSLDDLVLWNYLWAHPDDGTEFYTWDSEKGWVENKPWEVVEKMLNWFGRSRESREQVLRDLGMDNPVPSLWSKDYAKAVVDHGVFLVGNRLKELDAERHQRKLDVVSGTLGDVTYTPSESVNKVRECVVCEAPTNHHLGYCPECRKEGLHRKWFGDRVYRRMAVLRRRAIECEDSEMRRRLIRRLRELGG